MFCTVFTFNFIWNPSLKIKNICRDFAFILKDLNQNSSRIFLGITQRFSCSHLNHFVPSGFLWPERFPLFQQESIRKSEATNSYVVIEKHGQRKFCNWTVFCHFLLSHHLLPLTIWPPCSSSAARCCRSPVAVSSGHRLTEPSDTGTRLYHCSGPLRRKRREKL